jgi:hypothetical protein
MEKHCFAMQSSKISEWRHIKKYGITAGTGARPNVWHAEIAVLECESTRAKRQRENGITGPHND